MIRIMITVVKMMTMMVMRMRMMVTAMIMMMMMTKHKARQKRWLKNSGLTYQEALQIFACILWQHHSQIHQAALV